MTKTAKLTLALLAMAVPASQAQAACWTKTAEEAARIRDMDTMLMVTALRCRQTGDDFLPAYNRFVKESRPALLRVNETLRAHFAPAGGLNAYDHYVTSLANGYGAGTGDLSCANTASVLDAAIAERGSYEGLSRLAEATGGGPLLPGGRCSMTLAARE
jgi:hypothetical protein